MPASPPAPFDIARIVQDALGGGAIAPGAMDEDGWLQRSLREPDHFHASLFHYYRTLLREPPKSRPPGADAGYDFFNDLVLCQRHNPHPALRWHDPHHGWLALGYRELAAEAGALAAHWAACGVAEAAGLALV